MKRSVRSRTLGALPLLTAAAHAQTTVRTSVATNLVPGDTNGVMDVFVRGPLP